MNRIVKIRAATALGAVAVGAFAVAALTVGSVAIGRMAVGRLGIGGIRARHACIDRLSIGELTVERIARTNRRRA
jgi:hypothetical protein